MTDSYNLALQILETAEDKKAVDAIILNLKDVTLIADYFVICTGNSSTHVKAIADNIVEKIGQTPIRKEGYREAKWLLLDFGYVVVHVFQNETRQFYDLERLWGDADVVNVNNKY